MWGKKSFNINSVRIGKGSQEYLNFWYSYCFWICSSYVVYINHWKKESSREENKKIHVFLKLIIISDIFYLGAYQMSWILGSEACK